MHFEAASAMARHTTTTRSEMNAEANLADLCMTQDLPGAEAHCAAALALARRRGARDAEMFTAGNLMYVLTISGRHDEAIRLGTELLQVAGEQLRAARQIHARLAVLEALVGHVESAADHLAACRFWQESDDVQDRVGYSAVEAAVALAQKDYQAALDAAARTVDEALGGGVQVAHESVRLAFPNAIDAALAIPDLERGERLVELVAGRPPGELPPYLTAQVARCRSLIAAARGNDEVVQEGLTASEASFRELGYPYWVARAQLERAEWLTGQDRRDESATLASQAATTFERVDATPMLVRARALLEAEAEKGLDADSEFALVQNLPSPSD